MPTCAALAPAWVTSLVTIRVSVAAPDVAALAKSAPLSSKVHTRMVGADNTSVRSCPDAEVPAKARGAIAAPVDRSCSPAMSTRYAAACTA